MKRKTKIIVTVGPASSSSAMLSKLINAGINVVRLNFSHGTHQAHAEVLNFVRSFCKEKGKFVAILQDLQGPKIRIGNLSCGYQAKKGKEVIISAQSTGSSVIPVDYPLFDKEISIGDPILIEDGIIKLKAIRKTTEGVVCKVIQGGIINSRKGVNLPSTPLSLTSLTDKDKRDILWGIEQGVDFIALSFVRTARDILELKSILHKHKVEIPVIAKIERPEAVKNLSEILSFCEGVMIARGDLGVEEPAERVPFLQKKIIDLAIKGDKFAIVATQILDSMIHSPRPTRAEVTDIANAVYEGADALMLSGETSIGLYPLESVRLMDKIIKESEKHLPDFTGVYLHPEYKLADSLAHGAVAIGKDLKVKALVSFTISGFTPFLISKYQPPFLIFGATPNYNIACRMCMYRGVVPLLISMIKTPQDLINQIEKALCSKYNFKPKDVIVILGEFPSSGRKETANFLKIHII